MSPFGRATEDFLAFAERLPDRGEPVAPIGLLLSHGHGYERVNNACKMLNLFPETDADRELRELFNVCWHPVGVAEGMPAAPDVQSLPHGRYGNIFDVLVDRPEKAQVLRNYPVLWAAGDVELGGAMAKELDAYVKAGGTLVVTAEQAKKLPPALPGWKSKGTTVRTSAWITPGDTPHPTTPYEVEEVELDKAEPLAWADVRRQPLLVRNAVGKGAVITVLVPRGLGLDERAHPVLPYLMNGLTRDLLPVSVELPAGREIQYQVNRTKDGYVVLLMNNRGVDKTQHGVARVDRRQFVDLFLRTKLAVKSAKEWTDPRALTPTAGANGTTTIAVRVHPGDVQVIGIVTK